MPLYPPNPDLPLLEARLGKASAGERPGALAALAWALRQRDSARAQGLIDEAQALLDGQAAPASPASQRLRIRLALSASEIAALLCHFEVAEERLALARALLAEQPDPLASGDALLAEAAVAKARGQRERELEAYSRAAAVYAEARLLERQAQAEAWVAYENTFSEPKAATAPALPADPACDALWSAARGLRLSRREPAEAASLFLHASEQAQRVGMLRLAMICVINAGTALQGLGEVDDAVACFDLAERVAHQTGWPALLGASQTRLAALFNELGREEEAHALAGAALRSLAATPGGINRANACSELSRSLLLLGRGVEAVPPMAEAIRMYREARSTDNLALCLIHQGRALAAAGQPEAALLAVEECQALIQEHGFSTLQVALYEALAEIHRRHVLPPPAGLIATTPALHYAQAALHEGFKIAGWKPPAHLYALLAEDCAAAKDWASAYGHARRAIELMQVRPPSTPMRSLPTSDAAGLWRPAFAMPLVEGDKSMALQLTPKEREVLQLLALNYSNKEIATALSIGDETVKWHLKKVYAKLDAGSRKHAVTRARALGLIDVRA
ncbi:helix-turn-helix domain-containing protein [Roseateles microcysteis]|uniref:helix-turn-helix domain-containing protein n=1 Tax=Roseateles microcysteis TaxID=3119057 RepID=UPI002FE66104